MWQKLMSDADVLEFGQLMSYHHWRFAWYSFLDLLDINYKEVFRCPICGKGDSLDTVICWFTTVEPPLKGHLRNQHKCPLYRGVPSIEVTFIKIVGTFFSFGTKVCVP